MAKVFIHTINGKVYKIHGGLYTGFSFTNPLGEKSVLAFDDRVDVIHYIDERERGIYHFMDRLSDRMTEEQVQQYLLTH